VHPTRLASRLGLFDPEISGCSPGCWGNPFCLGQFQTTHRGPDVNLLTASTLGAFQHVTCHHCTHRRQLIAEFWVGKRCSACVEAWCTCLEWLPHLEIWGLPWPNTTPPFPPKDRLDNAATSYTPPPLHFCLFQGVYG
jgi:hypothetical protein